MTGRDYSCQEEPGLLTRKAKVDGILGVSNSIFYQLLIKVENNFQNIHQNPLISYYQLFKPILY